MSARPEPCIPIESLEDVSRLPADDPRRRHLETCPRCRALRAELEDFLLRAPAPPAARPGEARRELQQWLDELLSPATDGRGTRPAERSRWAAWAGPRGWSLAAAAATLVVAAGLWSVMRPTAPVPDAALRGEGGAPRGRMARELFGLAIEPGAREGLRLRWDAVARVDRYEVTVHASDLQVVARHDAGKRTELSVRDSVLHEWAQLDARLLRVRALRHGDEVARSGFVRLPERKAP